jgi:hypothetical protein
VKLLILGMLVVGPAIQGAEIETPLSASDKVTTRFGRLVDPLTFVWSAAGAGIGQWRDSPAEWGQGAKGLARRFAASEAFKVTQNSLAAGFDTALGLDPRFHPSHDSAIWPRVRSAVSQTFFAYKDSGGRMFNFSEVGGSYGAAFIANSWFPAHSNGGMNALERGTIGLGLNTASNVAKEFWPDIKRKVFHRQKRYSVP